MITTLFVMMKLLSGFFYHSGWMIAATGAVTAVIILGMALYLIIHFQLEADRKSKRKVKNRS